MAGSFQNEIPPARINLKLDVGKGDAKKKIELPLRMLILGDFSNRESDERIADREKISIDKNNFKQVMDSMNLALSYRVDDKISGSDGQIPVNLKISNMKSFRPEEVASQVTALNRLLAARNLIKDLKSNLLDNRELRKRLEAILQDKDQSQALLDELKAIVPDEVSPDPVNN